MRNRYEARSLTASGATHAGVAVSLMRGKFPAGKHRAIAKMACLLMLVLACVIPAGAQQTTGAVRGIVTDPNGGLVPGATVTISSKTVNYSKETTTTSEGEYRFDSLIPGQYEITISAPTFKTLTLTDVRAELNKTTDVPAQLEAGQITETVNVSAGGAELVETTTTQLSKTFSERQIVELAQTNVGGAFGGGVNNLALIAPGVSSSGGVGVGTGGSVGGQRPRNNNFVIDGVDNNSKSVTGPSNYVSPENVAEFSLIQNQFSAEYARSTGGQFITVTKSGTNDFHGSFYGFFRNRYLNALDTLQKAANVVREDPPPTGKTFMPRSDYFRGGFNVGGPIYLPRFGEGGRAVHSGKDKLFFYAAYERLQTGSAAAAGGISAPTAAGFAAINAVPGLDANSRAIFNLYVPVAPSANDTLPFCRVARDATGFCAAADTLSIPIGDVTFPAPNFTKQNNVVTNVDWNQSTKTTHRFRFNLTNIVTSDTAATLPIFFTGVPIKQRLFSYSMFHTFTSNLSNETRIAYRRSQQVFSVPPGFNYPALDIFPNIGLNDIGINVGPNPNAPQGTIENNYQIVDNVSYLWGNHSLKFGGDFRNVISPQIFTQRLRGDYQYNFTDIYLRDISPDFLAQRTVGGGVYYGNQKVLYTFAQDDWRIRPNITLNIGVSHSYQEVPRGAKLHGLNSAASVPGLITFKVPEAQTKNFGPKFGIAYSPNFTEGLLGRVFGTNGQSSIRAGFSMSYDYIFDNLYTNSKPPQAEVTVNVDPTAQVPNFLANGGIPNTAGGGVTFPTVAAQRAATTTYVADQDVPYGLTWTLSIQRQFLTNWSVEARYLGTRGVHLIAQNQINKQPKVGPFVGAGLPTFFSTLSQAQIDAMRGGLTLAQINARSAVRPDYLAAGFVNTITAYLFNGNSTYHGASISVIRRFANNFQFTGAYTWSHLIDDTTAEVFTTVLSPRRVEDFQNFRIDRADSALDRRHRFVASFIYELPFFRDSSSKFVRTFLGGFNFAGTYTAESGEKATVLSGNDSNLNGDAAPDRTIRNPNGVRNTTSTVTPLVASCTVFNGANCAQTVASRTVGYRANNPDAEYIQAGAGAISNSARNTLQLPGINNIDFSIFKNFRFGEGSKRIQLRADFFNLINHPQYVPGSVNDVAPIRTTTVANLNTVGRTDFNHPDRIFSNNPRVIQLALRFDF